MPATGDGAVNAETAANREPADLSLAGHVLLPVAIFVVTLLTLDFLLSANFAATIWAPNAIVLVALLRHTRNLRNYGSILVGSTCAIALANVAVGTSAVSAAIFGVANIFEVAVTLAFLSVLHINAANLTSFKNLLIFMVIAGGRGAGRQQRRQRDGDRRGARNSVARGLAPSLSSPCLGHDCRGAVSHQRHVAGVA